MGFWTLMEGLLLFANALAILNEDRFLAPKGWTLAELHQTGKRNSLKGQIVGLIHACQYMRLPLMLFNLIVIVVKLFSVVGCQKLKDTEWFSRQDPYVVLEYSGTRHRTRTCTDGGKKAVFQEKFMFTLLEGLRDLKVAVWNSNTLSTDDFIGNATIQLQKVLSQGYDDCTWTLQTKTGRFAGEVRLILHYAGAKKQNYGSAPSAPPYAPQVPQYSAPPAPSPYSSPPYSGPSPYPQGQYSQPQSAYPPASAYPPPPSTAYPPGPSAYPPGPSAYPPGPSAYPPPPPSSAYPPPPYPPQPSPYYPQGPYPGQYPPPTY